MYSYPILIVNATSLEDAYEVASGWVEVAWIECGHGGPYESGGVPDLIDANLNDIVLHSSSEHWPKTLAGAIESEQRMAQEYWGVLRTGFSALKARTECPDPTEEVTVRYKMGMGIDGVVKAGTEMQIKKSFGMLLFAAANLRDLHLHWEANRTSFIMNAACLYDGREDLAKPIDQLVSADDVYAVQLNLHH